jgi:uncharacterized protein with HEPN domain
MRPEDDEALLLDIVLAARKAQAFAADVTHEGFLDDEGLQLILVRLVQLMGEAARHVSASRRAATPSVPWRKMIGMRNHLVHGYRTIDLDVVWTTVRNDVPVLLAVLVPEIPPEVVEPQDGVRQEPSSDA